MGWVGDGNSWRQRRHSTIERPNHVQSQSDHEEQRLLQSDLMKGWIRVTVNMLSVSL